MCWSQEMTRMNILLRLIILTINKQTNRQTWLLRSEETGVWRAGVQLVEQSARYTAALNPHLKPICILCLELVLGVSVHGFIVSFCCLCFQSFELVVRLLCSSAAL